MHVMAWVISGSLVTVPLRWVILKLTGKKQILSLAGEGLRDILARLGVPFGQNEGLPHPPPPPNGRRVFVSTGTPRPRAESRNPGLRQTLLS